MVTAQSPARDFPVEWARPEHAEKLWAWDGMHCPRPLTPLSTDFATKVVSWAAALQGQPANEDGLPFFPNGYWYQAVEMPDPNAASDPGRQEREARIAAESKTARRLWQRRWLPQIRRITRRLGGTDCAAMTVPELTAHLARCIDDAGRAFGITLRAAGPMFHGVEQFYRFCEAELGAEGIGLAGAAVQGYANASSASEAALFELADLARSLGLGKTLAAVPAEEALSPLASSDQGRRFLSAFEAFLDRYGWRVPGWWELSLPSWQEQPAVPIGVVQRALRGEADDPRLLLRRSEQGRRAAMRKLRARLADPETRDQFEALWKSARQFVPISEGRALWQLSLGGYLRVPALTLGAKLKQAGALDEIDDLFYLKLAELSSDEGRSGWRELVRVRRAERERWAKVVPPSTIGKRPDPAAGGNGASAAPELPFGARMVSGFGSERSTDERVLKGHAASPGVVQGTAKVVQSVDEADKLEPGDILVCRFTTPSWSHLFSRVSAIVADSGGVLSHCAILAREYGIPCVPGVRVGTRRIRDGMLLTVDGTQGLVRLEE